MTDLNNRHLIRIPVTKILNTITLERLLKVCERKVIDTITPCVTCLVEPISSEMRCDIVSSEKGGVESKINMIILKDNIKIVKIQKVEFTVHKIQAIMNIAILEGDIAQR